MMQALFVSHGGGPLPLLDDLGHREMVACLKDIAARLARPEVILVVSAHWETDVPAVTSAGQPALIYDYSGFPPDAYTIQYACKGEPAFAQAVAAVLTHQGIRADLDAARGLDHGVFVPLKLLYPRADIPCVQLSLSRGLDPAFHLAIGGALQALAGRRVLLIGSGFSFHNMRQFFAPENAVARQHNTDFEHWLTSVCCDTSLAENERRDQLIHWENAPGARFCHPREEHLLPLHVCYGAMQRACDERYEVTILNKKSSMLLWA